MGNFFLRFQMSQEILHKNMHFYHIQQRKYSRCPGNLHEGLDYKIKHSTKNKFRIGNLGTDHLFSKKKQCISLQSKSFFNKYNENKVDANDILTQVLG